LEHRNVVTVEIWKVMNLAFVWTSTLDYNGISPPLPTAFTVLDNLEIPTNCTLPAKRPVPLQNSTQRL
jgi:hypothetical protein